MREGTFGFQFPRPDYGDIYADYLHSPVLFGQPDSSLRIPVGLLDTENASGDAESYSRARDMCHQLLSEAPAETLSMTDRVRRLLLSQLAGSMSEEEVAKLADLPSKDQLLGQLLGLINQPATMLARLLNEPGSQVARVMQANIDKG